MLKRRIANTIELDQSLRAARSFYVIASVILVTVAALTIPILLGGIMTLISTMSGNPQGDPGTAAGDVALSVISIGIAYVVVAQAVEASRRIKRLAEDPTADVKPMYVPAFLKNI